VLPDDVPTSSFGPGVEALVAYYTGGNRCSRRETAQILADVHGISISLGAVKSIEERVSKAIAPAVAEAAEAIQSSAVIHQDETSWRQGNKKAWLWVACNQLLSVFSIASSRKAEVSKAMLGDFNGVLVTDRYRGYMWYDMLDRAICHAHLKREYQRMAECRGATGKLGTKLLAEHRILFDLYHRFLDDPTMEWTALEREFLPIRDRT
jgi:transposase